MVPESILPAFIADPAGAEVTPHGSGHIHETYAVKSGDFVLIHAAAGGMGHMLCPWARHLGATVIGTVSTEEKAQIAEGLGCHHTINYSNEDFVERVREITGGEGVHVVYESIGRATLRRSLKCLRVRGMCAAADARAHDRRLGRDRHHARRPSRRLRIPAGHDATHRSLV